MNTKTYLTLFLAGALLIGGVAVAQETDTATPTETTVVETEVDDDLPEAGIAPDNPFHFLDRFFDNLGTAFVFNPARKAERKLRVAEERLAEARRLAELKDERADRALELYEQHLRQLEEEAAASDDPALQERLARATEKHARILERVLEKKRKTEEKVEAAEERLGATEEKIRIFLEKAKEKSLERHFKFLEKISEKRPERAAEILEKAAEKRLERLEKLAEEKDDEEVRRKLQEVERFSSMSQEKRLGEPFLKHEAVLRRVLEKAPAAAQPGLMRALENVERLRLRKLGVTTTTETTTPSESVVCTQEFDPVCGSDAKTYPNRCIAERQNKVRVVYFGKCREGEKFCPVCAAPLDKLSGGCRYVADDVLDEQGCPKSPCGKVVCDELKDTTTSNQTHTIIYTAGGYEPKNVAIKRGDRLIFVNQYSEMMWPASDVHPTHDNYPNSHIRKCGTDQKIFDACQGFGPKRTWSFRFDQVGTWGYHNHLRPGHQGVVVVEE